ncbi:MAG: 16S rRNA (cytosine(1402)-N(4))-methyltransferase RsmH [Phycisphaerae bacterium]|jgi:16S rRNA (cytosine1402-N4)-methyltransferase|nr:16S rRNA (cytosine(1402)-N(4))-methyltransferase RsmH [Phycisphaerae bacterium]
MAHEGLASKYSGHIPVLVKPLLDLLAPASGQIAVDCTVGLGGHAKTLLEKEPALTLIGLDMDPHALELAGKNLEPWKDRIKLVLANFSQLPDVLSELNIPAVDMIYADIGVSSMQIDRPDRGFSFLEEGPLDMRMNPSQTKRAADIVNGLKESELADILFRYGEETRSKKIAHLIIQARRSHRIDSTTELASIICQALGIDPQNLSRQRIHPATKTFQALRIAVNNELGNLESLLNSAPGLLAPQGRLAVISFHSLEDRMVKEDFKNRAQEGIYRIITSKPIEADPSEILRNSRSRSAKLRGAQKCS